MNDFGPQDLAKAVHGDMEKFSKMQQLAHAAIAEYRDALPALVVDKSDVQRVLVALKARRVSPELVQQWASFIRHGYLAGATEGSVIPIDIDYEPSSEEHIAELVSRLDELGDEIDGEIADQELDAMLHSTQ